MAILNLKIGQPNPMSPKAGNVRGYIGFVQYESDQTEYDVEANDEDITMMVYHWLDDHRECVEDVRRALEVLDMMDARRAQNN